MSRDIKPEPAKRVAERIGRGQRDAGYATVEAARPAGPELVAAAGRRPAACACGWSGTVADLRGLCCPRCSKGKDLGSTVEQAKAQKKTSRNGCVDCGEPRPDAPPGGGFRPKYCTACAMSRRVGPPGPNGRGDR